MNSTLKILLAFLFKLLLIAACIVGTFYIDDKLLQAKSVEVTNSNFDMNSDVNITETREPGSHEAKSSLSYYKVTGMGQITDRLHIEIIL